MLFTIDVLPKIRVAERGWVLYFWPQHRNRGRLILTSRSITMDFSFVLDNLLSLVDGLEIAFGSSDLFGSLGSSAM